MHAKQASGKRKSKEAALSALYDEYYDKIVRYIFAKIGNHAEAEDLAGEAFLKALHSLESYKERGFPMHAWLFKIAHNLIVDYLRRTSKRKIVSIETVKVADASDPQAITEIKMERVRLASALDQLTPAQRQVIELRFFGGLTSEDAGRILNKRSGAVREMQSAAISRLRKLLHEK